MSSLLRVLFIAFGCGLVYFKSFAYAQMGNPGAAIALIILLPISILLLVQFSLGLVSRRAALAHTISIIATAALFLVLDARISGEREPNIPPPAWYSQTSDIPNYNASILANAKIEKTISPGTYIAEVDMDKMQYQVRVPRKKKVRGGRFWIDGEELDHQTFPVYLRIRDSDLYEGCTVQLKVFGRGVPQPAIDAGFGSYVRRLGATSTLRSSRKYHVMGSNCPPPTIRDSVVRKIVSLLRDNLTESSVAISFLLGRTSYLSRELKTQAKELGVLHVFAASGMHLAVLYGVVMIPLSRFPGKKHPITAIIAFVPCLFYCWLLGFPISLTRALGFVIMYTLGILLSRRITTGDLILNTAMLLLIWMPSEMLTLSSVLSFGAVIGILFFYEPLCRLFFFKSYKMEILWKKMALPVSASLFTIPVISIVFHSHSFSSTIINLLIVPLADLLLPILFMALAVESLSIPAKAIWLVADHGIKLFVQLTESLSVASLYQESDAGTTLPLVCSICLLILLLHAKFFPGACGPVLVVCRRVVLILVMLIGPLGAGVMEIQSRLSARSIENSGSKERLLAEKESSD